MGISSGGDISHPWSPKVKFESKSQKTGKMNLRGAHRKLLSTGSADSFKYKPKSGRPFNPVDLNIPKKGKRTVGQIVYDDSVNHDGTLRELKKQSVTAKTRMISEKTKLRRSQPLIKSGYQDEKNNFHPAYSLDQLDLESKTDHVKKILQALAEELRQFAEGTANQKKLMSIRLVENLLGHPDTKFYFNAMLQKREPGIIVFNSGNGSYPVRNHLATFERQPALYDFNSFISQYQLADAQVREFYQSMNESIFYKDHFGNLIENIGPNVGRDKSLKSLSQLDSTDEL